MDSERHLAHPCSYLTEDVIKLSVTKAIYASGGTYTSTSALIVLSHNDRGVGPLIVYYFYG